MSEVETDIKIQREATPLILRYVSVSKASQIKPLDLKTKEKPSEKNDEDDLV